MGELKAPQVDNGSGLYSTSGLCDQLITILDQITISGAKNAYYLHLVASGIAHLRDTIRENGWDDGQDHVTE